MTSYFVIRHKATGLFMPETRGRGSTAWEPALGKNPHSAGKRITPRLFTRKAEAENSVGWWAQGEWVNDREDGMPMTLKAWNPRGAVPVLRSVEQLEVLEVELKLIGQMEMEV